MLFVEVFFFLRRLFLKKILPELVSDFRYRRILFLFVFADSGHGSFGITISQIDGRLKRLLIFYRGKFLVVIRSAALKAFLKILNRIFAFFYHSVSPSFPFDPSNLQEFPHKVYHMERKIQHLSYIFPK